MNLDKFLPAPIFFQGCDFKREYTKEYQEPVAGLVDAFLYLGPPDLSLNEEWPSDIFFDVDYRKELARRNVLMGVFEGSHWYRGFEKEAAESVEDPFTPTFNPPDLESMRKACLEGKPLPGVP